MKPYRVVGLVSIPLVAFTSACRGVYPENPGKHIDWMARHLEGELELTAAQRPAYYTIIAQIEAEAEVRSRKSRIALHELRTEVEKPALDVDRIATLVKTHLNDRPTPEEMDEFVDETADFIKQLSPEQQKKFAELLKDMIDWVE